MNTIDQRSLFFHLDSGLSLTTARDATEIESDHESKEMTSLINSQSTIYRPLITNRDGRDSDSDEVFIEVFSSISNDIFICLIDIDTIGSK